MTRGERATDEDDVASDDAADSSEIGDFLRQVARADPCEPGAAAPPDPLVGVLIDGKYRIDSLLGRGGMGTVYVATHLGTGRAVAVKVLVPDLTADAAAVDRFGREARAAGRIRHPNVVDVTDFGFAEQGGVRLAYLVMELLEGETLRALLDKKGRLPLDSAIDILAQIGAAVAEAHRLGILHRDLKPENIHLEPPEHGRHRVKVLDFGIAKLVQEASEAPASARPGSTPAAVPPGPPRSPLAATDSTGDPAIARTLPAGGGDASSGRSSAAIGTPRYMSPEQWLGNAIDTRTDIYSLGVMAYEMLAGEPPFQGRERSIWVEHAESAPPSLVQREPTIPSRIARVVEAALAKDPAARPPSARAFVAALYAGTETTARLLRRSLALCVDHFALFTRRCAPLTVPPIVMALLGVVTSLLAGAGVMSRRADMFAAGAARGATFLCLFLWAPITGSLAPLVASLLAARATPPPPPGLAELWRTFRRAIPSTFVFLLTIVVGAAIVLALGDGLAWVAGFRGHHGLLLAEPIASIVGSATVAPFAVFGPAITVEGARGLAPLRRSAALLRPTLRAAFGVTLFYQAINEGAPALTMLVLGNITAGVFHGPPPLDIERIHELMLWIVGGALAPFAVIPPALLYLRAREVEGNPLILPQ